MDGSPRFEIRYVPLTGPWPLLAFPCDATGSVPLDSLPDKVRNDYFFARVVAGNAYAAPAIARCDTHCIQIGH
jgi:hypothetical protein